ncbi:MAG: hypothetical protein IJE10_09450 [Clostridia bacterium]|nr:hypothetical protein [Clostridia bacterium]
MKRTFFLLALCFVLLLSLLPVQALNVGDVVGTIYNTDILAFVDGEPIRSFALDGKTAILVEDLARFGFVVGYDDASRTLYAYVKPNTFPHRPEENITRGTVGGTAGNIYHSDIQTYINGVLVPSFALNGVSAVAIEDIATDSTTDKSSHTCMTYTWDGENRTIRLNPVYDNTAKVAGAGNFYIENSEIHFVQDGRVPEGVFASIPDNAYALPLTYENQVVAHAYQTYITVPDQNNSDTHHLRTDKRFIIDWDYEAFLQRIAERENPVYTHAQLFAQESAKLTDPKTMEFEEYTLLYDTQSILSVSKSEPSYVTDFSELIALDGMVDVVTTYQKPNFTVKTAQKNENFGIFFIESDKGLFMLRAENGYGFLSRFEPAQSDIGTVYTRKSTRTVQMQKGAVTIDGNQTPITEIVYYGMWRYLPLKELTDAIGGTVTTDGLSVSVTAEGNHTYFCETEDVNHFPEVYPLADNGYHPVFLVNNTPKQLTTQITTGHFENTSLQTVELPLICMNGKIYVPVAPLDFLEYKEN